MKLEELFALIPTYEDYGQLPHPNLPSFDPKFSKVVGVFDGYDIWASREIPNHDVYGIRDANGDVLATCRFSSSGKNNIRAFREIWTRDDKRGQGLATILMLFVMRKVGIKLLLQHDEIISDDSRAMIWKGLNNQKFKMYNVSGTVIDLPTANVILSTLGKTEHEVILAEDKLNFGLFSNKKIDSGTEWYFVVGMNQDLD